MATREKTAIDDSASEILKSTSPSLAEKSHEAQADVQAKVPESSVNNSQNVNREEEDGALKRVISTTKEAQDELTRVMTSEVGVEYPTGLRLNLISLALCLSVFLMALVWIPEKYSGAFTYIVFKQDNTIIATAIPKITDQFHSVPDIG